MTIQKFINTFSLNPLYAKTLGRLDLEKFAQWRLKRSGKKDIKFDRLKSGLVALRLEVVNQGCSVESQDLSNGYHYIKTSLRHPFSPYEYTVDHGKLIRNKLQFPLITWLKEQIWVWIGLLSFLLLVFLIGKLNYQIAHYFLIVLGGIIFLLGLLLSVPNPPKRSPNYPLISFVPFLLIGFLVVVEAMRPNLLLGSNYSQAINATITDIQATSDPEKMLIVTANQGNYIVSGGNLYIGTSIKIDKFYFDHNKENAAIIFICKKNKKCITATEPERH